MLGRMWGRMRHRLLFGFVVLPFFYIWDTWQNDTWAEVPGWEWVLIVVWELVAVTIFFMSTGAEAPEAGADVTSEPEGDE